MVFTFHTEARIRPHNLCAIMIATCGILNLGMIDYVFKNGKATTLAPSDIFYQTDFPYSELSRDSFLRAFIVFLCNVNRKTVLHWGLNLNTYMQNACQMKKMTRSQRSTGCHDVIRIAFVILQKANYTMSVGRKKQGHGRVINRLAFECTDRKRF